MGKFFSSPQEIALAFVTMLWGATFLLIRMAMQECGPLCFVGIRFTTAACFLAVCSFPLLRSVTRRELLGGSVLGLVVFLGFSLQTAGLVDIPAAKSSFITAFYVPLVPLFELLIMRHAPSLRAWIGMFMGFLGILLLINPQGVSGGFGWGESLTVLCAVVFALEIVVIGIFAPDTNPRRLAICEVVVTAFLSFLCMPLTGETYPEFSWFFMIIACGLGCMTALIQSVMAWAQKSISPTRATIIYTCEPVWGGFFGFLAGERLSMLAILGCVLILAGILVSNIKETTQNR